MADAPHHPNPEQRLNDIIAAMRQEGCRITPQRRRVLQILTSTDEHLTVEQIYERLQADFPTTSLATVYKTLSLLKAMDQVLELSFGDHGKRYDASTPSPHPHLVSLQCGEIADVKDIDLDGVGDLVQQVREKTGFQLQSYRIDFFGTCAGCQESINQEPT